MPRRARRLTLAALVPLILAGCTAGPSTRPPVVENDGPPPREPAPTSSQAPLPELAEPRGSAVDWSDCGAETRQRLGTDGAESGGAVSYSCARITTTLDAPDLPRRGIKRIALLKAGTGPIPLVVVNDIDGEPGTLYAARLAATLPPEVLETFSLVGMDRRGTGRSDPARCIPSDVHATLLGHDPAAGLEPVLDAARTAGQQCAITLEDEQGALDSWRSAGDLDELRDQLGVTRLNAIGHGEGSTVVALFGARYPDRTGRLVLDGVPDPSSDRAAVLDGIAAGAEATLDAFSEQCATEQGCPLGGDARGDVTALTEQARRMPVPTGRGTALGPGLVLRAVLAGLAQRDRWGELAGALAAAKSGDGAKLSAFVEPMLVETEYAAARLDGSLATQCNDTVTRLPADQLATVAKDLGGKHPVFGALLAQELAWCSPWPSRREPAPDLGVPGTPPILVISTAVDPVTPERGTIRAAERMPSAVRVAWQGTGHGALGSPCVAEAARAFLVDGKVPRDGTLCPA